MDELTRLQAELEAERARRTAVEGELEETLRKARHVWDALSKILDAMQKVTLPAELGPVLLEVLPIAAGRIPENDPSDALRAERDKSDEACATWARRHDSLVVKVGVLRAELAEARTSIAAYEDGVEQWRAERDALKAQLAASEAAREKLTKELAGAPVDFVSPRACSVCGHFKHTPGGCASRIYFIHPRVEDGLCPCGLREERDAATATALAAQGEVGRLREKLTTVLRAAQTCVERGHHVACMSLGMCSYTRRPQRGPDACDYHPTHGCTCGLGALATALGPWKEKV